MLEYPKYKKVLFCTDFSENVDYAFEFAFGIAKRDKGLLYILHVIPDNPLIPHGRNKGCAERFVKSDVLENIQKCVQEDLDKKFTEHYVKKCRMVSNVKSSPDQEGKMRR
jgi:hypothetical protein